MRSSLCFAFAVSLLALGGCENTLGDGQASVQPSSYMATSPASASVPGLPVSGATMPGPTSLGAAREYGLVPGDVVIISVFQVPDLNKEAEIDAGGRISLPLIGQVQAGNKTVHELELDIASKLRARYLQSPQVSVFLKKAAGQQITMDGAVKLPGVYPTEGNMTLLRALARAGGFADVGDPTNVVVYHQENGQRSALTFNVDNIRAGKAPDPVLYGGDTVVVDESNTRTVWKNFKELAPAIGGVATLARPI